MHRYADQFLTDIYGWLVPVYATTGNNGTRWRGTDGLLEILLQIMVQVTWEPGTFRTFNTGAWSCCYVFRNVLVC